MERVAMERVVVESVRHPPALYWGMVSAAALCSVWGTFHLANRSKRSRGSKKVNSGFHAFRRLRRQYAVNLRPVLEDLVYLTMFLLNLLVGMFYWIMDRILDSHRKLPTPQLVVSSILGSCADSDDFRTVMGADGFPKRRGQIKRLRPRWAWARTAWANAWSRSKPKSNFRHRCECWGWTVKDLAVEDILTCNGSEILTRKLDGEPASQSSQDGDDENNIPPRWSECRCVHCAPLLMPMSLATKRLCVLSEENFRVKEAELPDTPLRAPPKWVSNEVTSKKERTAVIFIHGMFSSATFWFDTDIASNLSEGVRKQHHILAPDLLGCGRSPRPVDGLYTLADQIEAIEKSVIQRHNLESFHLVGHSMGSIITLALAARCPQRVRSITLIAPVYPPCCLREDGELVEIPCDAFFSFLDPLTLKGVRALTVCKYYNISRLLGHLFYARHTYWVSRVHNFLKRKGIVYPISFIHDYLTMYHDAAWHIAHNTLLAGTHAVIPALKTLKDTGHKILVIHGEIDTTIQFRLAEEMSRTFSNVTLVGVPEKGHVDIVWGRAEENAQLIEKAIREGDKKWSRPQ